MCYLFAPAVGGVETHVLRIGSNLAKWGHEVDVLTSDFLALNGFERISDMHDTVEGVGVYRFHGRFVHKTKIYSQRIKFPGFLSRLLTGSYDVVHCHSIASLHFDLSWWASKLLRKPIVVTGHYSPGDLDRLWTKRRRLGAFRYWPARLTYWKLWMAFALRHSDRIVAIAESEKERMIRYWGIRPEKVVVIPNGVDPQEFDGVDDSEAAEFRKARGLTDTPVVLFVGRISRRKGPDLLVKAGLDLLGRGTKAHFLIVGHAEEPDYLAEMVDEVRAAGFTSHFTFEEIDRRDVIRAFRASDIVVLPSRGEVFGITLVEGMYCEKVVIGSDSGGIPEVIEDGKTGFLFKNEDPDDLKRVLEHVITRYDTLADLRSTAKKTVLRKYTWESAANKLLSVYKELVS